MNEIEKIKQYRLNEIKAKEEREQAAMQFILGDKYTVIEQGWLQFLKPETFTPTRLTEVSNINIKIR